MSDNIHPDPKTLCHMTGFKKRCRDMVVKHNCRKWVRIQGKNMQTGAQMDHYDCRDHVEHLINIEILQAMRQHTATIDNLRKEVAQGNDQGMVGAISHLNDKMRQLNNESASALATIAAPERKLLE